MGKDRTITDGKLPDRVCPVCGEQVQKAIRYGQLSYICNSHCGPWDEAKPRSQSDAASKQAVKLTGDRCQCCACKAYFNSTYAFDMHRTGNYAARRCRSIEEMLALGMALNAKLFWISHAKADPSAPGMRSSGDLRNPLPLSLPEHTPGGAQIKKRPRGALQLP